MSLPKLLLRRYGKMSITSNKSFSDLYFRLVKEGNVKNHNKLLFLLEGYDLPDPYYHDLTNEEKEKIKEKAKNDFWYYMKEVVRIPVIGSSDGVPAAINKTNLAVLMTLLDGRNIYSNNARLLYGTMTRCIYVSWLIMKYGKSITHNIILYSENNEINKFFIDKVVLINDMLPDYMKRNYRDIKPIFHTITPNNLARFVDEYIKDPDVEKHHPLKGLLIINDLELCSKTPTLFREFKDKIVKRDIQFTGNGTVGEKGSSGRHSGDMLISQSVRWNDNNFSNMKSLKSSDNIIYVCYDYSELVDDPEDWYNKMSKCLNYCQDSLDREVLLKRE